jgi:hypothetical protein
MLYLTTISRYSKISAFYSFFFFFDASYNQAENKDFSSPFPRSFMLLSFYSSFRLSFNRGNIEKSFIVKPYHFGSCGGNFVFTRFQSISIHNRIKKKKSSIKKKR